MAGIERRLERFEADSDMDYILLKDGSRYWINKSELYKSFFLYRMECLRTDYEETERSPVPDVFLAIADAKDREEAMEKVCPGWRIWRTDHNLCTAVDLDVLVQDGRIEPYSEVAIIMADASEEELEEWRQFKAGVRGCYTAHTAPPRCLRVILGPLRRAVGS